MKKTPRKNVATKSITLDDVARMTQRGFDQMHEKFATVDKRFDGIDGHLENMDERLDRIENLLIRAHDNRLDKLDDQMRRVITIFEKKLSIPFPR